MQRPVAEGEATQVDGLRRCFRSRHSRTWPWHDLPHVKGEVTHTQPPLSLLSLSFTFSLPRREIECLSNHRGGVCIDDESAGRLCPLRLPALTRPCTAAKDLARNSSPGDWPLEAEPAGCCAPSSSCFLFLLFPAAARSSTCRISQDIENQFASLERVEACHGGFQSFTVRRSWVCQRHAEGVYVLLRFVFDTII